MSVINNSDSLQNLNDLINNVSLGNIEHISKLAENWGSLYLNPKYSDVILLVEGEKIYCHRLVLASRSVYFNSLLYGAPFMESSQPEVDLPDVPLQAFKLLLKYIYNGRLSLWEQTEDVILDILGLVNLYGLVDLEIAISDYLIQLLKLSNVCCILNRAHLYNLEKLLNSCHLFLDRNAQEILRHESFLQLSQHSLVKLLQRDSFFASELNIFQAVSNWITINGDSDQLIKDCVRLPLINANDLLTTVKSTRLITSDDIIEALSMQKNININNLPHRGQRIINENLALKRLGCDVIAGTNGADVLDSEEKKFAEHVIENFSEGIVIRLGTPSIINHIKMLLYQCDQRSYSYYIEVSVNGKDWIRIINYSQMLCQSWQYLYFPERVVKYIRIVGTLNTQNNGFHLVFFQTYYKLELPRILADVVWPNYNVATPDKGAKVIEGTNPIYLLNGDTENFDGTSGFTTHTIGKDSIMIQLSQPFIIQNMRLRLWDQDDRTCRYYIEISVNKVNWEKIVDNTEQDCHSWQILRFDPKVVVFIKIVGTHNSASGFFEGVHFECPSFTDSIGSSDSGDKEKQKV